MPNVICKNKDCSNEYYAKPHAIKKGEGKYCSRDCYYSGRKQDTKEKKKVLNTTCDRGGCDNQYYVSVGRRPQKEDILGSILGYYGKDLIIIDSEASFIYDDEFFEAMEFIDSVNVQQLELKYFDRLLDNKLTLFYNQPYVVPWYAYIPLVYYEFFLEIFY